MQPISNSLLRNAELYPTKLALVDVASGRSKTWSEAHRNARVYARSFGATHKLERGDRVAILSLNSDIYFELMFAVPYAKGIVVPLNFRLSPEELNHILLDSGAKILVVDEVHEKTVLPKLNLSNVKSVIKVETLVAMTATKIEEEKEDDDVALAPAAEDVYGIFYTSFKRHEMPGEVSVMPSVLPSSVNKRDGVSDARETHQTRQTAWPLEASIEATSSWTRSSHSPRSKTQSLCP